MSFGFAEKATQFFEVNASWKTLLLKQEHAVSKMTMSKEMIPQLIAALSQQQIDIVRVDYKNQLEEYFLKITKE